MSQEIRVSEEIHKGYNEKMKNKLFGLLCERENNGKWEKFLDSILIEMMGFSEFQKSINYETCFNKLSTLRYLEYKYFRSTIFECMNLFDKL